MRRRAPGVVAPLLFACACEERVTIIGAPETSTDGDGGAVTRADFDAACSAFCAGGEADCDLWRGFCSTSCDSIYVEPCAAESLALLECLHSQPPAACRVTASPCAPELGALGRCVSPNEDCEGLAHLVGPGVCSSSGVCRRRVVYQDCYEEGGTARCDCYDGTTLVESCADVAGVSCDLSCCERASL